MHRLAQTVCSADHREDSNANLANSYEVIAHCPMSCNEECITCCCGGVQVLEEGMGRRGEAVQPLMPVLHRTLADVQERLTFRAQAFIKVTASASSVTLSKCEASVIVKSVLPSRNPNFLRQV